MCQTFEPSRPLLPKNPQCHYVGGSCVARRNWSILFLKMTRGVLVQWTRQTIARWFKIFIFLVLHAQVSTTDNLIKMKAQCFQQDGAPPHITWEIRPLLRPHFDGRFTSLCDTVKWPPYSPHLTSPDFFLWGYLRDRIYGNTRPRTLDQLKENICW